MSSEQPLRGTRARNRAAHLALAALASLLLASVVLAHGWQVAQEGMETYFGLCTNGSIYVAVGESGEVWTSPDGETWTQRETPTLKRLGDVTYGGGQFVAVGDSDGGSDPPVILTSPDAETWTQQSAEAGAGNGLKGVAYAAGVYVGIGDGGLILTSTDGASWTAQTSPTTQTLRDVTYGWTLPLFVAVGDERTVLTSPDGLAWTERTGIPAEIPSRLAGVTYTGSQFVAVSQHPSAGEDSGAGIITSSDGVSWTQQSAPTLQPINDVTIGSGLIVAVGADGTVSSSSNGADWTLEVQNDPGQGVARSTYAVVFGPAGFLAGGVRGNIYWSPDGTTPWVSRTLPESRTLWAVAHGDGRYCAVGSNGAVQSSADGVAWTQEVGPDYEISDYSAYWHWVGIHHADGMFVAVGMSELVATSPDCQEWTIRHSQDGSVLLDITYGEGLWIATGETYPAPDEAALLILTSTDAVTWTPVPSGLATTELGYSWMPVAYGSGRFVVEATDYASGEPHVLVSEDGESWTPVVPAPLAIGESVRDIIFAESRFVAGGSFIWTSPDGTAWTKRYEPPWRVDGIAHGEQGYAAVDPLGRIFTSPDGDHWIEERPYSGDDGVVKRLRGVTSSADGSRFVTVGSSVVLYADSITPVFVDGFESGSTSSWSDSTPEP